MILRPFADENAVENAAKKSSSGLVLPSKRNAQAVTENPASKPVKIAQFILGLIYSKIAILLLVYGAFVLILAMNSEVGTEQTSLTRTLAAPWVQLKTAVSEQDARNKQREAYAAVIGAKQAELEYEEKSKQIELEHQQALTPVLVGRDADLKKNESVSNTCQQVYASMIQNADGVTELDRTVASVVGGGSSLIGNIFGSESITNWGDQYQDEVFLEGQVRKEGIRPVTDCLKAELGENHG